MVTVLDAIQMEQDKMAEGMQDCLWLECVLE